MASASDRDEGKVAGGDANAGAGEKSRPEVAYEAFRAGFHGSKACPAPAWNEAATWVRDVALVCYLQGKLDASATPTPPVDGGEWSDDAKVELASAINDVLNDMVDRGVKLTTEAASHIATSKAVHAVIAKYATPPASHAMREALRKLAIKPHVWFTQGGGAVPDGGHCEVCQGEWDVEKPEFHYDGCVAALSNSDQVR